MPLRVAVFIWLLVVCLAAFYGVRLGLRGPRFELVLSVAGALFAFEFFLAVPRVQDFLASRVRAEMLFVLVPLGAFLTYATAVHIGVWRTVIGSAYVLIPSLLLVHGAGKAFVTWNDYLAVIVIWLPVEFRWMYRLFPYPHALTHTLTILLALSTGVVAFVLVRGFEGIGYALDWRRGYFTTFAVLFTVFAAIAIPLGIKIGFLAWRPSLARMRYLPLNMLGILLFTAWPEEFLFRGLLQNLLSKTVRNSWLGLFIAAGIFGLSHILHAPFPDWKYVALASIAGVFYGLAWMRTRSLVPGVLIHALVDTSWHILFR